MREKELSQPSLGTGQSPEGRLDSWKEIAAYLGRGVRTAQRWELMEGMPVHRLAHERRGTVYARREELTAWWESRRLTLTGGVADETRAAPHLERVTRTAATTFWPALSSDGRMVAYVSDAGQDCMPPQIWLQQIGGGALRLTSEPHEYSQLSFSADDTRILFTGRSDAEQNVYEVPTLGGEPRLLQRAATIARFSPDGRWLAYLPIDSAEGVRIADRTGAAGRTVAGELVNVSCVVWSPDSRAPLVYACPDPDVEPDWWVIPIDGRSPATTGIIRKLRDEGMAGLGGTAAWVHDSVVFAAAAPAGMCLWRQRLAPSTFESVGERERLTGGNEFAWFPAAAGGRLAFVSSHADANLWSLATDRTSGIAHGGLSRMTRGPGILGHLTVTGNGRTLAYFSSRRGDGDVFLRDLDTGAETVVSDGPASKGFPAISPGGTRIAYATRVPGVRTMRPIWISCLSDGTTEKLGDDCGGRPRQWVDERFLVIERFGAFNSVALIDTATGAQRELLESEARSVKNPRVSPDGRWIAFDAASPGESPCVLAAPLREGSAVPEQEWMLVDRAASHPFWSADGSMLYYLPTGANPPFRSAVRARRFDGGLGRPEGEAITVFASTEMVIPAFLSGTAPVAARDRIILVLGDFRGDVWTMDLER